MFKFSNIKLPFKYEEFQRYILSAINDHTNLIQTGEALSLWWNMIMYLNEKHEIREGEDFWTKATYEITVRTKTGKDETKYFTDLEGNKTPKRLLYIRLSKIFPLYLENYRKQYGHNGLDLTSLKHYLTSHSSYVGYVKNTRFGEIVTSAYVFDYYKLKDSDFSLDRSSGNDVEIDKYEADQEEKQTSEPPKPEAKQEEMDLAPKVPKF